MPKVTQPATKKGDFLVDYEEKVFEDCLLYTSPSPRDS